MIANNCGLRLLADDDEGDDMSAVASLENVVKDAEAEWPSDSSSSFERLSRQTSSDDDVMSPKHVRQLSVHCDY